MGLSGEDFGEQERKEPNVLVQLDEDFAKKTEEMNKKGEEIEESVSALIRAREFYRIRKSLFWFRIQEKYKLWKYLNLKLDENSRIITGISVKGKSETIATLDGKDMLDYQKLGKADKEYSKLMEEVKIMYLQVTLQKDLLFKEIRTRYPNAVGNKKISIDLPNRRIMELEYDPMEIFISNLMGLGDSLF